jgi:hypothetical protein
MNNKHKNKYTTKKNKRKIRGGKNEVFDNFTKSMIKLTDSLKKLLEKIAKLKKEKESTRNEIPKDFLDKIEDQQDEMTKVLENIDKKEEEVNKENLDESKAELEKEIFFLREKINEGVKENFLVKNKERDRSFYLYGRTWNEWFYGFVEFYNELKESLRNIIENNYYNNILKKPISERTPNENEIIKKVNDLEVELTNLNNNNNMVKGGYRKYRLTRKKRYM